MDKEVLLNKVATRLMHEWDIEKFKTTHKRLFDVIMESMDEYAGLQVKKLNIDDVSKRCSVALKCVYSPDGKNCGMSKCVSSEFDKRPIHITDDGEWIGGNKDFYNK